VSDEPLAVSIAKYLNGDLWDATRDGDAAFERKRAEALRRAERVIEMVRGQGRVSDGKPTTGPWSYWPEDGEVLGGNNQSVAMVLLHERGDANGRLIASAPQLLAALEMLTVRYVDLAGSGDCGFWNPEEEPEVIAAREAIERATARNPTPSLKPLVAKGAGR